MAGGGTPLTQLQRRVAKRASLPSSPVSGTQAWEHALQPESTLSTQGFSADFLDSPSLDLRMPSPTFDVPGLGDTTSDLAKGATRDDALDSALSKSHPSDESTRSPYLSSPASDTGFRDSPRAQQTDAALRTSPLVHNYYDVSDGLRTSEVRNRFQDRPGSGGKTLGTNSVFSSERSLFDDASSRAPAAKKSRLNLLNPMSLLARRRSSQHGRLDELNVSPLQVPAIPDFDPSIRGKIVHDFSAPRIRTPRRELMSSPSQPQTLDQVAPQMQSASSPAQHSPMFREHFQDDYSTLQPGRNAYLHGKSLDAPNRDSLPAFAQRLPANLPSDPTPGEDEAVSEEGLQSDIPPTPPPKATPPPSTTPDHLPQAFLPKHMKSTSSRFSFQMSGQGSAAQEKLLEERHRERFPHGQNQSVDPDDDNYEDYDFDAGNDLEESIPGINSDYNDYGEEDEFDVGDVLIQDINFQSSRQHETDKDFGSDVTKSSVRNSRSTTQSLQQSPKPARHKDVQQLSLAGFHFTPQSSLLSPVSTGTGQGSEPTPRDSEGFPIGVADTRYSPQHFRTDFGGVYQGDTSQPNLFLEGLRISTGADDQDLDSLNESKPFDDADLYFDDGEFGTASIEDDVLFDEELLDDETHIRDIPAENARRYEDAMKQPMPAEELSALDQSAARDTTLSTIDNNLDARPDKSLHEQISSKPRSHSAGLTAGNLAAYHDALAMAANNAAASGRFDRQISFSESSNVPEDVPWSSSQSGLLSDESRYSLNAGHTVFPDDEPFPFDDDNDFDDELMIAEANAEALENDEDGFYGQEFGFYARAYGKDQTDLINGGYFTSRGFSGVKRSHSGKVNFQEPSLTPITERSEWSARNSVVSLQFHSGLPNAGQSLPSPGLNQLMESPAIEDEMSLSALIKLRRGAFGGSSTSINSMGERNLPSSSPLAQVSAYKLPQTEMQLNRMGSSNQNLHGSASIQESEEEEDDFGEPTTAVQNTPRKMSSDVVPRTPEQNKDTQKVNTPVTSKRSHHSRNSSGAESVSYARDDDGRWILERRRTGDDGELELIAREYLDSKRI